MAHSDPAPMTSGVTRKPGNLWTVEAREDMYNRRESGEGWETICQDYPNRSRHAMQQQYSMMKKQRALENGTWTMNRRGRKRRMLSPDHLRGEGELSDDDLSDGSPGRSHSLRLPSFSHIVNRTRPPFLRGTTDALFSRHLPAIRSSSDASSSLSPVLPSSTPDMNTQGAPDHRTEPNHLCRPYDPWHPKVPELAFTEHDVAALFQKGREQAARIVEDMNTRKEIMRKSKEEQISRYVAQLRDLQDQIAMEKGQGPYVQELNRRDKDIESMRSHISALQETLIERDNRILQIGNENSDIKARLAEIGKREDASKMLANSPPSTPIEFTRNSGKFGPWEEAILELSTRVDAASKCIKSMRSGLDKSSIGQIFQNIDELDLAMNLVVRDRDKMMSAFNQLQLTDEVVNQ